MGRMFKKSLKKVAVKKNWIIWVFTIIVCEGTGLKLYGTVSNEKIEKLIGEYYKTKDLTRQIEIAQELYMEGYYEVSQEERETLDRMIKEYYEQADPLRYEFHSRTGKFAEFTPSNFVETNLYRYAGAVYGKVEKIEKYKLQDLVSGPPYSSEVYIRPSTIFKDITTDSNGYVVIKRPWVRIADREELQIDEEVWVFLQDVPVFLLGLGPGMLPPTWREKALKSGKLPITSEALYYEPGDAAVVKNDTLIQKFPGGRRSRRFSLAKIALSEAIRIAENIEYEYKEFKERSER